MAKPLTIKSVISQTKKSMTSLGVYRKEFDPLIESYSNIVVQLRDCENKIASGEVSFYIQDINSKGVVSEKKHPVVTAMEKLRMDMLTYSDKLCLNPKALSDEKNRIDKNQPKGFEAVLTDLMGDSS